MRALALWTAVALGLAGAVPVHGARRASTPASVSPGVSWGLRPDGTPEAVPQPGSARAIVLFFVATDCPVSNRLFPEMRRVRAEFATRGVRVWFVYPNEGETAAGVLAHQAAFDAGGEALLDPHGTLVRLAGAKATPEAAVLVPDGHGGWRTAYAGRVDNRYVRLGVERPAATEHDAENAVEAVLEGKVPPPGGQPIGCAIMNDGARH